ncbi:mechanosensitive ion channel family protein [Propioniciclava soli]|uniref:Mechanosensitive ion channel family protein n=1 Tax=Propioniciclava soli TaxID=2775081 RepID=A0ABZ3C6U7_9ACTN|nr:mechanosensitive ion channel family protein [Propioniciclava soli]
MTPLITFTWPETALEILTVLVVAGIGRLVVARAIKLGVAASLHTADRRREGVTGRAEQILREVSGANDARHVARVKTIGSVLRNALDVVVFVLIVLTILSILGIPLGPLLASAGIGGVAIAFGAQSLVKDYITGILMILEDQFGVGDLIDTGEVTGTVEEVGLRVTRLRDSTGQVWYVRNGEIVRIGNQSQGWSTGSVGVPIAWDEDAARAIDVLQEVVDAVYADPRWQGVLLEKPTVAGVDAVADGAATLRIFAKTAPNQQWGVQRDLLERSTEALRRAGVRAPALRPPAPPA